MKRWLNKNIWTLSWVSFLQDAASEMLYPLMPVLLTSVLHAPAAVVGTIEGLAEGIAAATKLLSARINRVVPRKAMVFFGYLGAGLGKVIVALSSTWAGVLGGRLTDRVGKGLRSASRDSLLVEGTDVADRGKVIGFHRTADTLGAVLGPILALGLLAIFDHGDQAKAIRSVLWFAVIPAILSTALVLIVKDKQPATGNRPKVSPLVPGGVSSNSKIPARLRTVLIAVAAFSLVNFPDALVLLHVSQVGFNIQGVVEAYLLFNLAYAALNFPAGWLADRLQPNFVYAAGLLLFAISYGGMGLFHDSNSTLILLVIYGGFAAVNDTVGKSWISKLAPKDKQLWAQSMLQGFSGFGVLIAGLWAGSVWLLGAGAGTVALLVSGVVAVFAAIAMVLIGKD